MAVEEIIEIPGTVLGGIISIGRWLEAIGILLILWIILNIANFILNRKRIKEIGIIKKDMARIENKIDKINQNTQKLKVKK